MSATVAAALKKIAAALIGNKDVLKKAGTAVLVLLVAIFMPLVAIVSVFNGNLELDVGNLQQSIVENLSAEDITLLQKTEDTMVEIESAMTAAGFPARTREAQVLYILALEESSYQPEFVHRLVDCFVENQTEEQLIANVNQTFGTDIPLEEFSRVMDTIRANHIDTSRFVDPAAKNNLDLVEWAKQAEKAGWGYVWGTYGRVLTRELFDAKLAQYPDAVGEYADFILANWLGRRTVDCVGLIKGYGWFHPETQGIGYGTNGMPDAGANTLYRAASEKGTIDTIPEIPGLAVWMDGHIGIYIGGGEVIEARGTKYGVVKTRLAGRGWEGWAKIPYIQYIEEGGTP